MKKVLFLILAVAVASVASAASNITTLGGSLQNGANLKLGDFNSAQSCIAIPFRADVDITVGDMVQMSAGTTYYGAVSKTTTASDPDTIGVALETVSAGGEVDVCLFGVARINTSISVVAGTSYVQGGTAGRVSGVTAASLDLSPTSKVVTSLETLTVTGGSGTFLGIVK